MARRLVSVSRDVPFFHLEDVFVGLCLRQLGLRVRHVNGFHMNIPGYVKKDACAVWRSDVISLHRVPTASLYGYWAGADGCGNRTDLLPRVVVHVNP